MNFEYDDVVIFRLEGKENEKKENRSEGACSHLRHAIQTMCTLLIPSIPLKKQMHLFQYQ